MRRDIVFVHIPKTAGTSLRSLFEDAAPDHLVLRDYGNAPETTPELYKLVHLDKRAGDFRKAFNRPGKGILLSGHFPAERYWEHFNAESFVTFLRHPVDRIISEYVHFVTIKGWKGSLEEFVNRRGQRDTLSRFLRHVDLDAFGFIGFAEDFDDTLPALGEWLGVVLSPRRKNEGNYPAAGPDPRSDEKARAVIADVAAADVALYERLRRERGGRPRAPAAGREIEGQYIGHVQLRGGTAIGSLFNKAREFIVQVEISSAGDVLAAVPCDRYREGKKGKGSRAGVCGFRVELDTIVSPGRATGPVHLSFRAQGTDYELEGSPIEYVPRG